MKNESPRYSGKPLLRIVECYLLWAIGHLSEDDEAKLRAMKPSLRRVYKVDGEWQHIVAAVLDVPETFPSAVRQLWVKNSEIARRSGVVLGPQRFVEMFADENFGFSRDDG